MAIADKLEKIVKTLEGMIPADKAAELKEENAGAMSIEDMCEYVSDILPHIEAGESGGGSSVGIMFITATADMTGLHLNKEHSEIVNHLNNGGDAWVFNTRMIDNTRLTFACRYSGTSSDGTVYFTSTVSLGDSEHHTDTIIVYSDSTVSEMYN